MVAAWATLINIYLSQKREILIYLMGVKWEPNPAIQKNATIERVGRWGKSKWSVSNSSFVVKL